MEDTLLLSRNRCRAGYRWGENPFECRGSSAGGHQVPGVKSLLLTLISSRNHRVSHSPGAVFYDWTFLARDIFPVSSCSSRGRKEEQEGGIACSPDRSTRLSSLLSRHWPLRRQAPQRSLLEREKADFLGLRNWKSRSR